MKNLLLRKGWRLFCCIALCSMAGPAFATRHTACSTQQQEQVTGRITAGGMPMTGVTIAVTGKQQTAVSGDNGRYAIAAGPGDTLVFSYVGFTTVSEAVNGRTNIDISLKEDATALQAVTVNAGYYRVKEAESTGSIAKITAKDIETQPVTNMLAAMQGRMAGVSITQETGAPGGGFAITIRGTNSLRPDGNQPLYVVDGLPYASDAIGNSQTSLYLPNPTSPLNSINPDEIESIEVLKDADATAIYGSRGANGVVLVTTKKGKKGGAKYKVEASTGVGSVTKKMQLMDTQQYLAVRKQAYANDHIANYPATAYDVNGKWDQSRYTDWQEELIGGEAEITSLQASVSGGSGQTSFLLSGNSHTQTTVYPGNYNYRKGGGRLAVSHESPDGKFRANVTAGYTAQDNSQPAGDFTSMARNLAPNAPALYDASGNLNWENGTWDNPLAVLSGENRTKTADLVAGSNLSWKLPYNFGFTANIGFSSLRHRETRTSPSTMFNPANNVGSFYSSIFVNNTTRKSWIIEPQANWEHRYGGLRVEALAGTTFQDQQTDALVQLGEQFTSNSLIYDLASAGKLSAYSNQQTVYRYQAVYARVNLALSKRYFLNLTGRRDGSSRFGPGKRFANFGAVGAAWLFHRETFLQGLDWLSFGKLRGSYGTTGNDQIGDYQYLDTYASSGTAYDGAIGLQPTRLFNPGFGWEKNTKLEAALELGFFSDRITAGAAWFRNRSSNQLVGIPLAATTGFTSLNANLNATVENRGWELTLRTVNLRAKNFSWTTSFNLTVPENKLISFPGLEESAYKDQYIIGQSVNIKRLYQHTGINPETGIFTFTDVNGDGAIAFGDDNKFARDFSPKYFGGIQNQLAYKGVQLDFLFQFVSQENWNYIAMLGRPGARRNNSPQAMDAWQQPGDNTANQVLTSGTNGAAVQAYSRYAASDAAVSDASYIRLKNLSLSYNIPVKAAMKCRLVAEAQNLLTITPYKDGDPEFTTSGFLPPLKVMTIGAQLNF